MQLAHTLSWVSEHGDAVYLPTPQAVQDLHLEPVQNSLPLRHSMQRASCVSEHCDAVSLLTRVQLVHGTHCEPVQTALPLRHPPPARTRPAAGEDCVAPRPGRAPPHGSAQSSASPARTATRGMAGLVHPRIAAVGSFPGPVVPGTRGTGSR